MEHFLRSHHYSSTNLIAPLRMQFTTAEARCALLKEKHKLLLEGAQRSRNNADKLAAECAAEDWSSARSTPRRRRR